MRTPPPPAERPACAFSGRYYILEELGRGGMARVCKAREVSTGRLLALKQLTPVGRTREIATLFEREFQVLAQLCHPCVIEVYDYGIDRATPYYTMELLEGGDLRDLAPLSWRKACDLSFDVCTSLSLLHARRLLHRDVSPRNVRCAGVGHAKLIDFGAMAAIGTAAPLVGTPPFVAPEALHGAALDARTDLFSLGATLYYALTGHLAFPAHGFSELRDAWSSQPLPPSAFVNGIPPALDQLVMCLISLEPAQRPRSAFEVMQRLAAMANLERDGLLLEVSRAHLVTPSLIGREEVHAKLRQQLQAARQRRGGTLLCTGPTGSGRSRMSAEFVLEAKLAGACVVCSAPAAVSVSQLAAARALALQLAESWPEESVAAACRAGVSELLFESEASQPPALRSFARPLAEQTALQRALVAWMIELSERVLLAVAIDDADLVDTPSLALLAGLAEAAHNHAIALLLSTGQARSPHLDVLSDHSAEVSLRALTAEETEQLLSSVFGDVPNLGLVSRRLYGAAAGNPRETLSLAHHLVERAAIRYDGGAWSLPAQLTAADLPASSTEAWRARSAAQRPLAKRLLHALAVAEYDAFSREDCQLLAAGETPAAVDAALQELLSQRWLVHDGRGYQLAQRSLVGVIQGALTEAELREQHLALAELYARTQRSEFAAAAHLLEAGEPARALQRLLPMLSQFVTWREIYALANAPMPQIARTIARALHAACELRLPLKDQHALRMWSTQLSTLEDHTLYWQAAPEWRRRLEQDSGLQAWRALGSVTDSQQRLSSALRIAAQRYAETPEADRVYSPEQAIRGLVHYVSYSVPVGARSLDAALLLSLPGLLEPFVPLSPLVEALWQNAIATCEVAVFRQVEQGCARWRRLFERLGQVQGQDPALVRSLRMPVAFGVGLAEASLGLQSAGTWADILDGQDQQAVNAMYLRKVLRLQQGDLEGAEHFRKRAELLALQANLPQMFTGIVGLELNVHFAAGDLTGVKQLAARIEPLAARYPGWLPFRSLAEGHYQRLRGDLAAACRAYEHTLQLATPDAREPARQITAWPAAVAAYTETLLAINRAGEAKTVAERALAESERREMGAAANDIVRSLALTEAHLGDVEAAAARLDALIERQQTLGVSGLSLGTSYEARTWVAIAAGDHTLVERYAALTAEQYRYGRGSTLGARYERLMSEARAARVQAPARPEFSLENSATLGSTLGWRRR